MSFPVPDLPRNPAPEPAAMIRVAAREDAQWSRPIFKAPPLDLCLQALDASTIAEDLRRVGLGER